jgi:hypothetical protein
MKTYHGFRQVTLLPGRRVPRTVCVVEVRTPGKCRPLRMRLDIRAHSPTGFEWGYGGSGPAQLALALCVDACGRSGANPRVYQRVKRDVICKLRHAGWTLTQGDIMLAVERARQLAVSDGSGTEHKGE